MNIKTESINKNFSSFAKLLHWGFVILFLYGLLKQIDSINQLEDDNLLMFEVIFALAFLEAGNTWNNSNTFNPFDIKRSAGVGIRMMIPMMGIMGVDWGYGFDEVIGSPSANGSQFHFSINQQF